MALKPCRECGAEVSTHAEICPQCGARSPAESTLTVPLGGDIDAEESRRRLFVPFLAVVGCIVAVVALYQRPNVQSTPQQPESGSQPSKQSELDPFDAADVMWGRDDLDTASIVDAVLKNLLPLAQQGNAQAQSRIGFVYLIFKRQNAEALKWFQEAALKGSPSAMFYLGNMYWIREDFVEAEKWYILSASHTGPLAKGEMNTLDDAIKTRDLLARKMTASQIADAQKRASEWSQQHNFALSQTKTLPDQPNR